MVLWRFINSILNDGCQIFIKNDYVYRSIPLPWSVMAVKHLYAGTFLFLHHFPMIIVANLIFNVDFFTLKLFTYCMQYQLWQSLLFRLFCYWVYLLPDIEMFKVLYQVYFQ